MTGKELIIHQEKITGKSSRKIIQQLHLCVNVKKMNIYPAYISE